MTESSEKFIKNIFRGWKSQQPPAESAHPDEETLVDFIEGRLETVDQERLGEHLLKCGPCAEALALHRSLQGIELREAPQELIERVKDLVILEARGLLLEIALRLKEKAIEILATTGDVLMGQELVPAPILRSRSIKDFKDEVTILKDFEDIRVEAKIENKGNNAFSLNIFVKQKQTQKVIKDLRVTLLKEDVELESYLTEAGVVKFEHVLLGRYRVEISNIDQKLAAIVLDIKT